MRESDMRFSAKAVADSLNLSAKLIMTRAVRLGIKTNRRGYSMEDIRAIAAVGLQHREHSSDVHYIRCALGLEVAVCPLQHQT